MLRMSYTRGSGVFESFLTKERAKKANSFIPFSSRKGRILDIGCGTLPYFLLNTQFKEKFGMDPVLKYSLKQENLFLNKVKVEGKKLPYKDNFFDVVTMLAVFEHIENDQIGNVLQEVLRVLKKNGVFIITTPAPWADKLLHFMAKYKLISEEEIHEHKHNHRKSKIEDIIRDAGFSQDKTKSGFFEFYMNMWFTAYK